MSEESRLRVVIIGGYGTFGRRLVDLLADDHRLKIFVAGRSLERARHCVRSCAAAIVAPQGAELVAARFDRNGDLAVQMQQLKPDIVIDAAGPFQIYGEDPYRVVRTALAESAHYLDLADGREFVQGIDQCNEDALAAGKFVLSGVSTFPALSGAVVRTLAADMDTVEAVEAGVAPSPRADLGLNVIKAIISYAGRRIALAGENGAHGYGLTDVRRRTIIVPGIAPLPQMAFSLVDVPDPPFLAAHWPGLKSAWFGVGTRPQVFHFCLVLSAWLVRLRILPGLGRLAGLMHFVTRTFTWGDHRSGMFVTVIGQAGGRTSRRSWAVIAESDAGLNIPVIAAAVTVRRLADGAPPAAGARAADEDFELADYQPWFERFGIRTALLDDNARHADLPLYRRLLGAAFSALSPQIRAAHDINGRHQFSGTAAVERGEGMLSRLIAAIIGFPVPGKDIPLKVMMSVSRGRELWQRDFDGERFRSRQFAGAGRNSGLLMERFGLLTFGLCLVRNGDRLRLVERNWNLFGPPLPRFLMPKIDAYEDVIDGRFNFHVRISVPLAGLIVGYEGWLEPVEQAAPGSAAV